MGAGDGAPRPAARLAVGHGIAHQRLQPLVRAADKARQDEAVARAIEKLREELGLEDDEQIVARVIKKKR